MKTKSHKVADIAQNYILALASGKGATLNLKTGLDFLDNWQPIRIGEAIILGARPGVGKTTFCINLALNLSQRYKTLYITSEATTVQLTEGMLSNLSSIGTEVFNNDSLLNATIEDALKTELKQLENRELYILETGDYFHKEYLKIVENQLKEHKFQFLIIQPSLLLKTVKLGRKDISKNRKIVSKIKALCSKYQVSILMSVNLPRSLEKRQTKKPTYRDIAHLGIDQIFDKVMLLYRPEYYGITEDFVGEDIRGLTYLIVAKNNYGSIGETQLRLIEYCRQFVAWDGSKYIEI